MDSLHRSPKHIRVMKGEQSVSFWKKEKEVPPPVSGAPADSQEIGSAADVDEVMKKFDRESNVRVWEGTPK